LASSLNPDTVAHLKQQHPAPERFDAFLEACQRPSRQAIRVSESSLPVVQSWADSNHWQLAPTPWNCHGFWVETPDERSLGNHVGHLSGHFYIQEATSMLPVTALMHNHQPHYVLDMAAAPGSKTTQLGQRLTGEHLIVANDMSSSRTKMLNANLIRMGISEYSLLNRDATRLHEAFYGQFDSILLDAPCGGEGTIRKDPRAWSNWSLDSLQRLSELQKALVDSAWSLLKPGGRLVYSTCSLSREENQEVIEYLLEQQTDDAELISLEDLFTGAEKYSDQGMLHIWPEVLDTEGFFVACIQKSAHAYSHESAYTTTSHNTPGSKQVDLIGSYYREHFGINLPADTRRFKTAPDKNKTQYWLLPEHGIDGTRYQRQGIHLCTVIEGRKDITINTHHDFVRCYGQQAQQNQITISADEAVNFFQGKNLTSGTTHNTGETILQFEGRAIGLCKQLKGGQLKNQLPRDLVHDKAWS
jgi:16S rRNA (cytosine1407-C5)-methyltransferase